MSEWHQILDDGDGGYGVPLALASTKEAAAAYLLVMMVGGSRESYSDAEIAHIAASFSEAVEFWTHDPATFDGSCGCEDADWMCPDGDGPSGGVHFWTECPDFDFDDLIETP